jgi:hypothetical protein
MWSWTRHWNLVQRQSRWRTESIHGRSFHRIGDGVR